MEENQILNLIDKAIEARKNSYAPYSKFYVGASILTYDNRIFIGTNVENSSFSSTICAERSAIASAISNGYRNLKAIVIVALDEEFVFPCGVCRQVIAEFNIKYIIVANLNKKYKIYKLEDLLPYAFKLRKEEVWEKETDH